MNETGFPNLTVVDHPLVRHKLTLMREKSCPTGEFRRLLHEITLLLGYELLRDLKLETRRIETPMAEMEGAALAGRKLALISILRAGNGMLEPMLDLVPSARVGFVGLYRDHETLKAIEYYNKLPEDLAERPVALVDPMLATANSAVAAIDLVKRAGARDLRFLCLLAAPEGAARMQEAHPDVRVVTAALDERLDERGYIVPGLGDAGDRLFGTR